MPTLTTFAVRFVLVLMLLAALAAWPFFKAYELAMYLRAWWIVRVVRGE